MLHTYFYVLPCSSRAVTLPLNEGMCSLVCCMVLSHHIPPDEGLGAERVAWLSRYTIWSSSWSRSQLPYTVPMGGGTAQHTHLHLLYGTHVRNPYHVALSDTWRRGILMDGENLVWIVHWL